MSQASSSKTTSELVFYVDEKDDDFTFYLDCERDKAVIDALGQKKASKTAQGPGPAAKGILPRSYSERVQVRNLYLTKDSLEGSKEFWSCLENSEPGSLCELLRQRLSHHKESSAWFEQRKTSKQAEQKLLTQISKILNELIAEPDSATSDKVSEVNPGVSPWLAGDLPEGEEALIGLLADDDKKRRWRRRFLLEQTIPGLIKSSQTGRGLICFSYVGRYLSVTFRKIAQDHGFEPDQSTNREKYLFSWYEYCDLLYREIFQATGSEHHAHGLLVISGSTNSGKSEVARGLIHLFLDRKDSENRRKHLVTFEDPVERFYVNETAKAGSPWMAVDLTVKGQGKDYTPRQKEDDAAALEEALTDALRQTPSLFFVGETRESEEWKVLLNFAATGHLIVTTAHAGSLVEAMHRIFEAVDVQTAADRSEIANKLLAVIHLRGEPLSFMPKPAPAAAEAGEERNAPRSKPASRKAAQTGAVFPSLWRRTPRGIAALTSDGLASLLPYRPKINPTRSSSEKTTADPFQAANNVNSSESVDSPDPNGSGKEVSSLGRRWLIEQLLRGTAESALQEVFEERFEAIRSQAYQKSTEWDLEGV